jgi:hypothetical protein
MEQQTNTKELNDLLKALEAAPEACFSLLLTNRTKYSFRRLNTNNLKELIKTVVDSPLTQSAFNTTVTNVMKETITPTMDVLGLNVVDRLLFCLTTRIESLSPVLTLTKDKESLEVNLVQCRDQIQQNIAKNLTLFDTQKTTLNNITLTYRIPLLKAEEQLSKEINKTTDINISTPEELRKVIGDAFIQEIATTIETVRVGDSVLDLQQISFANRIKTVEALPATAIQEVIKFIEQYKKVTESALTKDSWVVPIDGSLFSQR